jgi:hypothetical protein
MSGSTDITVRALASRMRNQGVIQVADRQKMLIS